MLIALAAIGAYVVLLGVASFIEVPVGRGFKALQLNALIRVGSSALAIAALFALDRINLPAPVFLGAGIGIGLLAGGGSICYCFALNYLPVSLVVTVANLSIVVTIALGVVFLHESVGPLRIAALVLTVAGALVLSRAPAKHAVEPPEDGAPSYHRVPGFSMLGLYLALVGVSTFLEKPALRHLDATQLNALQAIGMLLVAAVSLTVVRGFPKLGWHAAGSVGVGAMIGLGSIFYFLGLSRLPISIAVGMANGYVVITVLLSALIGRIGLNWSARIAVGLTVAGVTLFAFSAS